MEPFPTVFARVSPEDKMKIVHALQSRQEVVSMTGDGVNDAPAIRHADVGVAMGITGTDLTKEAADIVLTDDNFTSIIRAVAEGRRIMDNIILFLVYLLSCNSGEIWTMLLCVLGGLPTPFTSLQILWGNLIIDSPPSLALGVQPAAPNVLIRLPRNPDQGIFTWKSLTLLVMQGVSLGFLSVTLFVVEYVGYGYSVLDPSSAVYKDGLLHAQGHCFITISLMQLAQGFAGRSITASIFRQNFFNNIYLIMGIGVSFGLLVACMYIPGWNTLFDQYPMNWIDWIVSLGMVCTHLAFVELLKFCLRRNCFRKERAHDPLEKEWYMG
jgi:Ca2+-transporting ATPase